MVLRLGEKFEMLMKPTNISKRNIKKNGQELVCNKRSKCNTFDAVQLFQK